MELAANPVGGGAWRAEKWGIIPLISPIVLVFVII
jgi:hypothetical protein